MMSTRTRGLQPLSSFAIFAKDIKLSHSIFALPFVVSTCLLIDFSWDAYRTILILLCMISARSFAMGANRYLDAKIDAQNPRTSNRMIPSGHLKRYQGVAWTLLFAALFMMFSFQLSTLAGLLSPIVLFILGAYPFMKRLTWMTHLYLGLCLGLSPMGVSVALTGQIQPVSLYLGAAVAFWVAGFDIMYAFQDYDFDVAYSLKSVPSEFGFAGAKWISRMFFVLASALWFQVGHESGLGALYVLGVVIVSGLLFYEQWIVRDSTEDKVSSRINKAFFDLNACVGLVYLLFLVLDQTL